MQCLKYDFYALKIKNSGIGHLPLEKSMLATQRKGKEKCLKALTWNSWAWELKSSKPRNSFEKKWRNELMKS